MEEKTLQERVEYLETQLQLCWDQMASGLRNVESKIDELESRVSRTEAPITLQEIDQTSQEGLLRYIDDLHKRIKMNLENKKLEKK
jgi:hypothetical protein